MWVGMFVIPLSTAMSQAIWLAKAEPDVQGRLFAVRLMLSQALLPLAYILAGPLADKVFVPLMTESSGLGDWLQGIMGSGVSRGYALFFVATGLFVIVSTVIAWMYPPLRNLERDVPDFDEATDSHRFA